MLTGVDHVEEWEKYLRHESNTDEFPNLATSFGVMSIPTLILFIDGAESGKLIGLQSKDDILDFINKK